MNDEELDVNAPEALPEEDSEEVEEVEQDQEASSDPAGESEGTPEPPKVPEKTVPYDRFAEVNTQKKRLEEYIKQNLHPQQSPTQVQPDEEGNIDPNQLIAVAEERANRRMKTELAERDDWAAAVEAYPELKDNPTLKRMIKGAKTAALIEDGELVTYKEVADELIGGVLHKTAEKAQKEGYESARTNETIQKRSGIKAPSSESGENDKEKVMRLTRHPDQAIADRATIEAIQKGYI